MSIFSHFICELQNYTHVKTVSKEAHMTGLLQKHFYIGPLMSCSSIRSKLLLRITSDHNEHFMLHLNEIEFPQGSGRWCYGSTYIFCTLT